MSSGGGGGEAARQPAISAHFRAQKSRSTDLAKPSSTSAIASPSSSPTRSPSPRKRSSGSGVRKSGGGSGSPTKKASAMADIAHLFGHARPASSAMLTPPESISTSILDLPTLPRPLPLLMTSAKADVVVLDDVDNPINDSFLSSTSSPSGPTLASVAAVTLKNSPPAPLRGLRLSAVSPQRPQERVRAHEVYRQLVDGPPLSVEEVLAGARHSSQRKVLPDEYQLLQRIFEALDTVLSFHRQRKEQSIFSNIVRPVENIVRRRVTHHHLGQLFAVDADAFWLTPVRVDDGASYVIECAVDTGSADGLVPESMWSAVMARRAQRFRDRLEAHHEQHGGDAIAPAELPELQDSLSSTDIRHILLHSRAAPAAPAAAAAVEEKPQSGAAAAPPSALPTPPPSPTKTSSVLRRVALAMDMVYMTEKKMSVPIERLAAQMAVSLQTTTGEGRRLVQQVSERLGAWVAVVNVQGTQYCKLQRNEQGETVKLASVIAQLDARG